MLRCFNHHFKLMNFKFELLNSFFISFVFSVLAENQQDQFRYNRKIRLNIHYASFEGVLAGLGWYFQYLPGQFFLSRSTHKLNALKSKKYLNFDTQLGFRGGYA